MQIVCAVSNTTMRLQARRYVPRRTRASRFHGATPVRLDNGLTNDDKDCALITSINLAANDSRRAPRQSRERVSFSAYRSARTCTNDRPVVDAVESRFTFGFAYLLAQLLPGNQGNCTGERPAEKYPLNDLTRS